MFSNRSSLSESRRPMMICPSSGADVSADGEGYDHDDDVTETKRRKSKIELDRYVSQHKVIFRIHQKVFL